MTREERTVAIIFLVNFLYGFAYFVQAGVFIVPIPLFPVFAFALSIYFCFIHFNEQKGVSVFMALATLLDLLQSPVFMTSFLSEETHLNNAAVDLIQLGSRLFLSVGITWCLFVSGDRKKNLFAFATGALVLLSTFFNSRVLYALALFIVGCSPRIFPKINAYPVHLMASTLLVFDSVEWVMMHYYA